MTAVLQSSPSPAFRQALQTAAAAAQMTDSTLPPSAPTLGRRRRGGRQLLDDDFGCFSLVNIDGVLEWRENLPVAAGDGRRGPLGAARRRAGPPRRLGVADVEVVDQFPFVKLAPSQVTQFLNDLDLALTPNQGLFKVDAAGNLTPSQAPVKGRALVLIHGTFSDPQRCVNGLRHNRPKDFLSHALKHYHQEVYVFGHPTLAVSPIENALQLAHLFRESKATVDVIAHSRGGLVTRWWFEGVWRGDARPGTAVLVGSPLAGTSLASPPRLRATFKLLTNVANALAAASGAASTVAPIMTMVTGLMKLVGSFTSVMSNAPVTDAVIAMVPGFVAQSRVGNQPGLLLLRNQFPRAAPPKYCVITADFEPASVPLWQFWKLFTVQQVTDAATDRIFEAPNDLVVDTESMSDFAADYLVDKNNRLALAKGPTVHHTNYFEHAPVIEFISKRLFTE